MRIPTSIARTEVGFNMTPMIDVVFLLIIFFLVSSHLAKQEAQLELPLPTADSGETPVVTTAPRLTINVLADGSVNLAGKPTSLEQLVERLNTRRLEETEELEIQIRTHQDVPFADFEPVMLACTNAGVWNINIAVHRKQDVGR